MGGDHLQGNRVKDSCCNECRFRKLRPLPDLNWTIKELFVSGENTIMVRGEATGTPIKTFLGAEPTERSFRTMSIVSTRSPIQGSRAYHVENWTAASRQLANG
jgi:hypothetical protein